MSFFSQKSTGEKIFDLIASYSHKLSRISAAKKYTFIEAHALLFMDFFTYAANKQGENNNPVFDKMLSDVHTKFKALPDQDAKQILLSNGYRSMWEFLEDRLDYFQKNLDTYFNIGQGAVLSGICFALYFKPLTKIHYVELEGGIIGFTKDYEYTNIPVIIEFMGIYKTVRKQFEQDYLNILNKEIFN